MKYEIGDVVKYVKSENGEAHTIVGINEPLFGGDMEYITEDGGSYEESELAKLDGTFVVYDPKGTAIKGSKDVKVQVNKLKTFWVGYVSIGEDEFNTACYLDRNDAINETFFYLRVMEKRLAAAAASLQARRFGKGDIDIKEGNSDD